VAALVLVGATALTAASLAYAVAIDGTELTTGDGTVWDPIADDTAWCIKDDPTGFTPVAEGYTTNRSDAFDNGLMLVAKKTPFEDSDGEGDVTGPELAVGPDALSGLEVSAKVRALDAGPTLRVLYKLKNTGDTKVSRRLKLDSNLGSDDASTIERTSSGDRKLKPGDRWIVSSDGDPPGDPPVTHALSGKHAAVPVAKVYEVPGEACPHGDYSDAVIVGYNVSVPAGATRYLMFFAQMNDESIDDAVSKADAFNPRKLSNGLLQGIPDGLQSKILNWGL
jgi:hypothetical protein